VEDARRLEAARPWLAAALLIVATVACSFRAYLYFSTDEHFSIVEFAGVKLGWSRTTDLPWDYAGAIRPWLQPSLYFLVAKVAHALGVDSHFHQVALFRLATGLFCCGAYVALATRNAPELRRDALLLAFLPYVFTRTSAEALGGGLLVLAWLAYFPSARAGEDARTPAPEDRRWFLAGALFGLAFDVRPQTALFAVGLFAWSLVHERERSARGWTALCLGGACALGALVLVDRWGYGRWVVSPYRYFVANIIDGMASSFGTSPFYAYAYLPLENAFAPLALYAILVTILAAVRNPRHPAVWAVGLFIAVHSAIPHKEDRFLLPVAPFVAVLLPLAFRGSESERTRRWLERLKRFGRFASVAGAVSLGWMLVAPYGNCNVGTERFIELHADRLAPVVVIEPPGWRFVRQPSYERQPWFEFTSADELPAALQQSRLLYVVAYDSPLEAGRCPSETLHGRCVRAWSEFPIGGSEAHDRWLARVEAVQEWLRRRFDPHRPGHPTFYAVYEFFPSAPGPPSNG